MPIGNYSEGASRPILREKDSKVQAKALEKLVDKINAGKKVTVKDTTQFVRDARLEVQKEENPDYEVIADNCNVKWFTGNYFDKLSHLRDIDLILTDPPYNTQFDSKEWDLLGQFAFKVLADGSYFVSYCGHVQQSDIFSTLPNYL